MIAPATVEAIARSTGAVVVVRTVDAAAGDPLAWFAEARLRFGEAVYFARPDRGLSIVGAGVATADEAATIVCDQATDAAGGPLWLGGYGFDPGEPSDARWAAFPARRFVIPRCTLRLSASGARVTLAASVAAGADIAAVERALDAHLTALMGAVRPAAAPPPRMIARSETPSGWGAAVEATAADIRGGAYAKAVLARRVDLALDGPVDVVGALERLHAAHPAATIYAFARGATCFLGASPERLVRVEHGRFEVDAVAGTIARGADGAEDDALAKTLFASAKDAVEHDLVVRWLRETLAGVAGDISAAPEPRLRALGNVQHLYTPIWGTTTHGVRELVERLHPTPAVAGVPREAALRTIRAREGFDRGWYAGPVGWTDRDGDGEFSVALRCALVGPRTASLYAGAGIVGDSRSDAEYAETQLKLRAMTSALGLDA